MDSITHVLSGLILAAPMRETANQPARARWRETAAIFFSGFLPDADGVLGYISLDLYAKYHRVVTHSIPGLIVLALLAAALARHWPASIWPFFLKEKTHLLSPPSSFRLIGFSFLAITLHWLGDWIGQWGVWPLWPFSNRDVALGRVNSLDFVLFGLTLAFWTIQKALALRGIRKPAWIVAAAWLAVCVLYIWLRPLYGEPAYV